MAENRREDRGAPECTIGEDVAFVARLENPDAPPIPFLMEPSYYDSGAGYYRFKSDDERTLCELTPRMEPWCASAAPVSRPVTVTVRSVVLLPVRWR